MKKCLENNSTSSYGQNQAALFDSSSIKLGSTVTDSPSVGKAGICSYETIRKAKSEINLKDRISTCVLTDIFLKFTEN